MKNQSLTVLKFLWRFDILNKSKSYDVVNDLLKFLLCQLKENEIAISHFRIQKTAFKIKKELGADHPLYEYLPFYWYEHGPFSNVVAKQFNILKDNNCTSYSSNTVFINNDSLNKFLHEPNLVNDYPKIKQISQRIFEDKNDFLNKFDEDIYIDYAPFSFMHTFKYDLFEPSRNDDFIYSGEYDNFLDNIYDCLSNLPYDNLLNDFSILFSRLFSRLELINDENQFFNCWSYIAISIQQSWQTFARWVSIYDHDNFYNEDISKWKTNLNKRVKLFNKAVNYLEDKTDYILNNPSQDNYTSFEDRIYNATIGNYLME